ncbi:hypothetical protein ACQB60_26350 [Actinomycetota bacterium Odt1-20B]
MSIWLPEPGEILYTREPITFATGEAPRVRGMRWFRDTERNDIQGELEGWPEGPEYTARSTSGSVARTVGRGGVMALGAAVMAVLSAAGGNLSGGSGEDSGSDTPDSPADEVEDFPVMWAAEGTIARTLPWQLDPGRSNEKHYQTHMSITDRRLVVVGLPLYKKDEDRIEDEVLWETPRSTIDRAESRNFKDGFDLQIVFTDGSWCRMRSTSYARRRILRYLAKQLDFVPLDALTPSQQATVEAFVTDYEPDAGPPLITQNSCGCYRVEVVLPSKVNAYFGARDWDMVMDTDGKKLELTEYHPEDLSENNL